MPSWVDDVLGFWLGELAPQDWFRRNDTTDGAIVARFATVHAEIARRAARDLAPDARTALSAVIVLDQFSRNMFRSRPEAFACDALAREVADLAIGMGFDQAFDKNGRLFFYLPFEHSELAADQERSVRLIEVLGDPELTRYAVAHKVIIDRFGRFPHRNAALGRASTNEEIAFLKEPGSSF